MAPDRRDSGGAAQEATMDKEKLRRQFEEFKRFGRRARSNDGDRIPIVGRPFENPPPADQPDVVVTRRESEETEIYFDR